MLARTVLLLLLLLLLLVGVLRVVRVRVRVRVQVAQAGNAGRTTIPHIRTVRARSRAGGGRCWEGAGRGDEGLRAAVDVAESGARADGWSTSFRCVGGTGGCASSGVERGKRGKA